MLRSDFPKLIAILGCVEFCPRVCIVYIANKSARNKRHLVLTFEQKSLLTKLQLALEGSIKDAFTIGVTSKSQISARAKP